MKGLRDERSRSFRTVKVWEGQAPFLVWQISAPGLKRAYLILDAQQQQAGIRLSTEKPEDLKEGGTLVNTLRKYAKTAGIGPIMRDRQSDELFLPLYTQKGPPTLIVQLARSLPPEIRLVTPQNEILVRRSSQGSYTKRRAFEGFLPAVFALNEDPDGGGALKDERLEVVIPVFPPTPPNKPVEDLPLADQGIDADHGSQIAANSLPSLLPDYQRDARDRLSRRLKTVRKALSKTQQDLPSPAAITAAEREGQLLKEHIHQLQVGMHELVILDPEGQRITLSLDPEKSPGHNLESFFIRAKKLKRAREILSAKLETARTQTEAMERDLANLRAAPLSWQQVEAILARFRLASTRLHSSSGQNLGVRQTSGTASRQAAKARAEGSAQAYRVYLFKEGERALEVLVGKGAEANDDLCKAAKANDYWLHASAVTGSHVLIPARQLTGGSPHAELLRFAAILALHHSRLRGDLRGEVYLTQRRHLRKKKGLPAGLWLIDKAETLFFRYDEQELQRILEAVKP